MTQYNPAAKDEKHLIAVGWDPMLNTLFFHVIDITKDEDDEGRDVVWVPKPPNRSLDLGEVVQLIEEYCDLDINGKKILVGRLARESD